MPNIVEHDRVRVTEGDFAGEIGTMSGAYGNWLVIELDCESGGRLFDPQHLVVTGDRVTPEPRYTVNDPATLDIKPSYAVRSPTPLGQRPVDDAAKKQTVRERMQSTCAGCGRKVANCECLELQFLGQVRGDGLPEPIRQFPFATPRKYAADFAWIDHWLIVEVEGGGPVGAHQRGRYESDCRKYALATLLGWRVLRFGTAMIKKGEAIQILKLFFAADPNPVRDFPKPYPKRRRN